MSEPMLPAGRSSLELLGRVTRFREFMIVVIILLAVVIMSCLSKSFLTRGNLLVLLLSISVEAIVVIGMTNLLISGGFDLSVGSTAALGGAVTAMCLVALAPAESPATLDAALAPAALVSPAAMHPALILLAVLAGLAVGVVVGLVNGLIIAKIGINPFITTLGMMGIVRGALMVVTNGKDITGLPRSFNWIGQEFLCGVQHPILIAVVLVIAGDLLLRKSRFFRQNYYLGGNEKAARLSGIPVARMKIFNYALMGFLAALAGVVMTARYGSASVTAAEGMDLSVISAVIIGGASLQGGEGTVLGSVLGSLLMAIIVGSLSQLRVDVYWQQLVVGATLLLAVLIDTLGKRRQRLS